MKASICAQCGAEIDDAGIAFKGRTFCSDECCEEYEDLLALGGGPDAGELEDDLEEGLDGDLAADLDDDALGYEDDADDGQDFDLDEDEFDIRPEHF